MKEPAMDRAPVHASRFVRWLMATGGVVCVGLAALGAVVPGLPTTVFLIAASYLFVRSCPMLERKLVRNRFFKPFLVYLDQPSAMPLRAQIITLVLMWGSVTISVVLLALNNRVPVWVLPLPVLAAAVGTYFIVGLGARRRISRPA